MLMGEQQERASNRWNSQAYNCQSLTFGELGFEKLGQFKQKMKVAVIVQNMTQHHWCY